ncbi:glutamine synthetase family protein [Hyphococcus formosus]|uniref:glutamine synthetase family protein n=1 Tax=Hyphococcus formosus TaxID=3143534 RepID=UPI00398AED3E
MSTPSTYDDRQAMLSSAKAMLDASPNLVFVDAFFADLNGVLRGKRLPARDALKLFKSGLRLPRSLVGVDVWGEDVIGNGLVMETGDSDGICHPVGEGLIPTPWTGDSTAQVMLMMGDTDGSPFLADPRQMLIEMKDRCAAADMFPVAAMELEFYLLARDTDDQGRPLTANMGATGRRVSDAKLYAMNELDAFSDFFSDLYAACDQQGVSLGAAIVEGGAGQFEVNLLHQDDPLRAADQAILFRRAVKGVADKHGLLSTFMAKPFGDLGGNGLHVHMSMLNSEGENIFDDGTENGSAKLQNAIAGLIDASPEAMIFLAPHLNSMRRFQDESHAPTRLTWGYENRTVAIRVPNDSGKNRRFEYRIAGADANPYLVLAALLAGVLDGVSNNKTAPAPTTGNGYLTDAPRIPTSWRDALDCFAGGKILSPAFGPLFTQVFCALKQQEMRVANSRVTDFEYDSYLQAF